jgi:apolipoprotein N-acyltransferase
MPDHWPRWARRAAWAALGVLAGLGQAPQDLWPASVLALALVFVAYARPTSAAQAGLHLWLFGVGYFGFALRWIIEPFLIDIARHGWMAPFALVAMAAGMALFWGLAGYLAARLSPRAPHVLALLLLLAEMTRSVVLTGFPWALLGHIWVPSWLAQAASLGGPHLLTALALLAGLGLAQVLRPDLRYGGRGRGLAVLAVLAILAFTLRAGPVMAPDAGAPIVRMVQPNAAQDLKWDPAFQDLFLQRLLALSAQGPRPDLVIWPETAVPYLLDDVVGELALFDQATRGAPLVFGVQRRDMQGQYYNAMVLLTAGGVIADIYDKRHLVPFGEYIPFGEILGRLGLRGLAARDGGGFAAGRNADPLLIPGIGAAVPLICYEGIFAHQISAGAGPDRARMLLLITNDGWFGPAAGPYQHLAQARLRAIEQGIPMVRSANTGVTAMIDAKGRITAALPLQTQGVLDAPLPAALAPTVYARSGDWPIWILALLTLAGVIRRRSL